MNDAYSHILLVDAHQDLAWNMLSFGRDYTRPAAETRQLEQGSETPKRNGDTLLGWPEYQQGRVAVIFATLFAAPARKKVGAWDHQCYTDSEQAARLYSAQLDAYHRLVESQGEKFRLLETLPDLHAHLTQWRRGEEDNPPVGLVVLMEGAEAVRSPAELEEWWRRGVRIIGPAWAGTRFCGGTGEPGPLTKEGYALLEGMAGFGFGLDLSHMDEQAALQALDTYAGVLLASHANAAALLPGVESNRFLSDRLIQGILDREGVIGVVPFNRFLLPGWQERDGRQRVTLEHVFAQIDYICQKAGDAHHVGLGSDFDGGFGVQRVPQEIDTIADLRLLIPLLAEHGYNDEDITAIMGKNWLTLLERILPEERI